MENKIVVHAKDGTIHKGVTHDFNPSEPAFHMLPAEGGGVPFSLRLDDLKALFYVRDYAGNREFQARKEFGETAEDRRRAIVEFEDGEEIRGVLGEGADGDGPGFFFFPADENDNNIRIFVIRSAMREMRLVS